MQEIFSIEDVINVMIELETCGNEHYLSLSKQTQSEELKNLFLNLANAEQKHKLRYENFKKEILNFEHENVSDDYEAYMLSLLKQTIRFLNETRNQINVEEGFLLAIQLEKDTILFLLELKSMIGQQFNADMEQIISEERGHLKLLYQYQNHLQV